MLYALFRVDDGSWMLFRRDPSPLPLACRVCTLVQYVYAQTGDVCFMGSGGGVAGPHGQRHGAHQRDRRTRRNAHTPAYATVNSTEFSNSYIYTSAE